MPISSIPSAYGIGTFGRASYDFVDFLKKAGQKLWQILPLGPTGYGDSPYQSFSTFAGNPYFIDLEILIGDGYLTREECEACDFGDDAHSIDYEKMYFTRFPILRKAYERALAANLRRRKEYREFLAQNEAWLPDYALYMAVKDHFGGVCFLEWDEDIRLRKKAAVQRYTKELAVEIGFYQFQQYLFAKQWGELKAYANQNGIEIVGDIPIYVAFDSADTWAHPELFCLDKKGYPTAVAGCPPDAFSETGQLWGNPLYDWKYHRETGYDWWMQRIAHCYKLYDVLRIDHFRGFDEYWAVPYGDPTAEFGRWEKGPGYELFAVMRKELGKRQVIAEDLGFLTPSVVRLVKRSGFPSMKVLQFGFEAYADSGYLPHNYDRNCVVYTGTHDNDTTVGWLDSLGKKDRKYVKKYLNVQKKKEVCRALIRAAVACSADTAIIPMQDYLELGTQARINVPSTLGTNWKWRMDADALSDALALEIRKLAEIYGRL